MPNNPNTLSAQLRQYNAWRRGQGNYDTDEPHPGPNPKDLGLLLDTIAERLDHWQPVIVAAVELVFAPSWAVASNEDVALEQALRNAGLVKDAEHTNRSGNIGGNK